MLNHEQRGTGRPPPRDETAAIQSMRDQGHMEAVDTLRTFGAKNAYLLIVDDNIGGVRICVSANMERMVEIEIEPAQRELMLRVMEVLEVALETMPEEEG